MVPEVFARTTGVDPNDPRVKSLAATMGEKVKSDDLEIALAKADENNIRRFIDDTQPILLRQYRSKVGKTRQ